MIDPHVHCRDWKQYRKETIVHALNVADRAGISGIFDMPNTDPAITTRALVEERLNLAKSANSPVFYGLYVGITPDPNQIKEAVKAWRDLFSATSDNIKKITYGRVGVVGFKMYAGKSVGDLEIIKENEQKLVYKVLADEGFDGVLAVHCEKESLLRPELWDPSKPITHCDARPFNAEVESIRDQINFSKDANFNGHLHICHVSNEISVFLVDDARFKKQRISCGVTPHHCMLDESYMKQKDGMLYKVNSPLKNSLFGPSALLYALEKGKIDWIETDHAPHTLDDKLNKHMSGFPGLPFYPHFINYLKKCGLPDESLHKVTHYNIEDTFKIGIRPLEWISGKTPDLNLHTEYEVDVYKDARAKCV